MICQSFILLTLEMDKIVSLPIAMKPRCHHRRRFLSLGHTHPGCELLFFGDVILLCREKEKGVRPAPSSSHSCHGCGGDMLFSHLHMA